MWGQKWLYLFVLIENNFLVIVIPENYPSIQTFILKR